MLFGYTSGGSPIFVGSSKPLKRNKNTRYRCSHPQCNARTTKNQRKKNGNVCFQCKTPFKHNEGI